MLNKTAKSAISVVTTINNLINPKTLCFTLTEETLLQASHLKSELLITKPDFKKPTFLPQYGHFGYSNFIHKKLSP